MNEDEIYGHERLNTAVHSLVIGTGGIRDRLRSAIVGLFPLRAEKFADRDLRDKYQSILRRTKIVDIAGLEGTIQASLAKLSDDDCQEIAGSILDLANILRHRRSRWIIASGTDID